MSSTEITVQVFEKAEDAKRKLVKNGFNLIETYTLNDFYFSKYPLSRLKKMSYKSLIKNSFLLRETTGSATSVCIEHKAKKVGKNDVVLSEEKISSFVDGMGALDVFLRAGLTMWANIKNHSFVFEKDGFEFVLQVVDGLGVFVEIEEQGGMQNLSSSKKIAALKACANGLGLRLGSDYSCKKPFMLFKLND